MDVAVVGDNRLRFVHVRDDVVVHSYLCSSPTRSRSTGGPAPPAAQDRHRPRQTCSPTSAWRSASTATWRRSRPRYPCSEGRCCYRRASCCSWQRPSDEPEPDSAASPSRCLDPVARRLRQRRPISRSALPAGQPLVDPDRLCSPVGCRAMPSNSVSRRRLVQPRAAVQTPPRHVAPRPTPPTRPACPLAHHPSRPATTTRAARVSRQVPER